VLPPIPPRPGDASELERLIGAVAGGATRVRPELLREFERTAVWFHENGAIAYGWQAWTREGPLRAYLRRMDPNGQARIATAPGGELLNSTRRVVQLNMGTPLAVIFEGGGVRTADFAYTRTSLGWPDSIAAEGICPHCDAALAEPGDGYCAECGGAVRA
jgi:hypothetical protein